MWIGNTEGSEIQSCEGEGDSPHVQSGGFVIRMVPFSKCCCGKTGNWYSPSNKLHSRTQVERKQNTSPGFAASPQNGLPVPQKYIHMPAADKRAPGGGFILKRPTEEPACCCSFSHPVASLSSWQQQYAGARCMLGDYMHSLMDSVQNRIPGGKHRSANGRDLRPHQMGNESKQRH